MGRTRREPDGRPLPRRRGHCVGGGHRHARLRRPLVASIGQLRSLTPGLIIGVGLMLSRAWRWCPLCSAFRRHRVLADDGEAPRPGTRDTLDDRAAVAKRAGMVLLGSVIVLVALATGVFNLKVTYDELAELPQSNPRPWPELGLARPSRRVPGPSEAFVTLTGPTRQGSVDALAAELGHTQGVAQVLPVQSPTRTRPP